MDCNCLKHCGIEFDTIALYVNFKDGGVDTMRYLFDKFIKEESIDLNKIELVFNHINYTELQKYGQQSRLNDIKWLLSIPGGKMNFFTDIRNLEDDYITMYNYVTYQDSIALFLGNLDNILSKEYDEYIKCLGIPVIHITPDFKVNERWVGDSDMCINYYLDNLS